MSGVRLNRLTDGQGEVVKSFLDRGRLNGMLLDIIHVRNGDSLLTNLFRILCQAFISHAMTRNALRCLEICKPHNPAKTLLRAMDRVVCVSRGKTCPVIWGTHHLTMCSILDT